MRGSNFSEGAAMGTIFAKYLSVGVINTLIHWVVFTTIYALGLSQSASNLIAFCCAVTFSFFLNANWTFKSKATSIRYTLFVIFMGSLALITGWIADILNIKPLMTLIVFSTISLCCGFIYSKFIVFR
jgi:putative flippase GtrA